MQERPRALPHQSRADDMNDRVPTVGDLTEEQFVTGCVAQLTPLYRYFYHQTGHIHDAEDLVSTTVSKALAGLARFDPASGTFPAWLFGIARHTLRDHQRRSHPMVSVSSLDPPPPDPTPPPDLYAVQAEEFTLLHHRVRTLPIGQREAVMLYYFGALSAREVAVVLGRSEGAVRLLIHRGLTTLRGQYREEAPA